MLNIKQKIPVDESFVKPNESTDLGKLLYSRTETPFGISWEEWTMKWWKWILSIPKKINPGYDPTGEKLCVNGQGEKGPVIFLVGTFGGPAERTYLIPSGKAILVPIINFTFCSTGEPFELSEEELQNRARNDIDDLVEKYASIDGKMIDEIEKYRVRSRTFDVVYPKDNVFGLKDGPTKSVSDGYWVFLKPMERSIHHLQVLGSCSSGKTRVDITFHLKII